MTDLAAPLAGPAPTGGWHTALVRSIVRPGPDAVVVRLDVPGRTDHLPGQHYVVRLTGPDGYTAQRSYSITTPPSDPGIELYVERLPGGEVSGFLADVLTVGDTLDVRGPIGGWFVWDGEQPALCVGGGSGVAPLMAMQRHARDQGRLDLVRLVVAARTLADLPYADELAAVGAAMALSRQAHAGRAAGRIRPEDLQPHLRAGVRAFVCGSAAFAEAASQMLVELGMPSTDVRVERFGPTG